MDEDCISGTAEELGGKVGRLTIADLVAPPASGATFLFSRSARIVPRGRTTLD